MREEIEVLMEVANSLADEVYGLCSGGKDSVAACSLANKYRKLDGIATIDTTCAVFKIESGVKIYPAFEAAEKFVSAGKIKQTAPAEVLQNS
mgnify:CR=1 FL=1